MCASVHVWRTGVECRLVCRTKAPILRGPPKRGCPPLRHTVHHSTCARVARRSFGAAGAVGSSGAFGAVGSSGAARSPGFARWHDTRAQSVARRLPPVPPIRPQSILHVPPFSLSFRFLLLLIAGSMSFPPTTFAPTRFPPETEKIVVEKWCYFPEVYKMTKVLEDRRENGLKINFPLTFSYVNFEIFSKFQILIGF